MMKFGSAELSLCFIFNSRLFVLGLIHPDGPSVFFKEKFNNAILLSIVVLLPFNPFNIHNTTN